MSQFPCVEKLLSTYFLQFTGKIFHLSLGLIRLSELALGLRNVIEKKRISEGKTYQHPYPLLVSVSPLRDRVLGV